jgi:predicted dehydrogenase
MAKLRVAIIGARRQRQGIGEFVAREFLAAGAELCAIVGTRESSVQEALAALPPAGAETASGFTSLARALDQTGPDIVAICSPYGFHRKALEDIAKIGCHCLCEKPMWWESGPDVASETARLVDAFVERGLHLALMTQWPETLADFYRLYPEVEGQPVQEFGMHLAPRQGGSNMVLDAASHPISMLQTLLGRGDIENVEAKYSRADPRALCLTFSYRHAAGVTTARCQFTTCEEPPRPASYSLNGRWVHRTVELPDYRLFLGKSLLEERCPGEESATKGNAEEQAEEKRIPIEDPLKTLVVGFVRKVERAGNDSGAGVQRQLLIESMQGLQVLVDATEAAEKRQVVEST